MGLIDDIRKSILPAPAAPPPPSFPPKGTAAAGAEDDGRGIGPIDPEAFEKEKQQLIEDKKDEVKALSETELSLIRQRAEESLYIFELAVLRYDWLVPRIHRPLCRLLEDFTINTRLAACLPRGWLKTTVASIGYPMWRAVKNPNVTCLLTQNTVTNAIAKGSSVNGHFKENALFRTLWPELLPTKAETWRGDAMCVRRTKTVPEATFEFAGIGTQVTSRHYNLINEDDTVAPDVSDLGEMNLAPTKDDIEQAIGWHRLVPPLLTNPTTDQNLVIGTRWFEKDLLSWIFENQKDFKTYVRACKEDESGKSDPEGTLTYEERFSQGVLDELEVSMGPYMFSCLYMNLPLRSSDMIFRLEWFQYYDTEPQDLLAYTTVDLATDPEESKGNPDLDYNVVMTIGKSVSTGRLYLLRYDRFKGSPGHMIDTLFEHARIYKPVIVGVEAIAYQKSVIYWIKEQKQKREIHFLIEAITHGKRSKVQRIMGLQPIMAGGMFFCRRHHTDFINEALSFPLGKHDDLLDAASMQIPFWALTQRQRKTTDRDIDPYSIEAAINELHQRGKPAAGEIDIYDTIDDRLDLEENWV